MDLSDLSLFSMMSRRMSWLTHRQKVLAHNIANADTPNYAPMDLRKPNFSKFLRPTVARTEMRTTSAKHIEAIHRPPNIRTDKEKETYEVAPDGNAVVIEEQLFKVNETQGSYRLATNLYKKHLSMIKAAIGRDR